MALLSINIESIFAIGSNATMVGKVDAGKLSIGQKILIHSPTANIEAIVKGIEIKRNIVSTCKEGDEIGLMFQNINFSAINDGITKDKETGTITVKSIVISQCAKMWWQFWL